MNSKISKVTELLNMILLTTGGLLSLMKSASDMYLPAIVLP